MPDVQGPAPKDFEQHIATTLNIQTQWAVPAKETKRDQSQKI